ncbi:helix-turn-helix domain-containing protein [Arthrobacter sp. ZBG10]|uniref:helix-turn-helix domain-containing protein n=1 Tax=Arthrobacter sp. ZBG10 TaxID=1676590 RepID=UPI0009E2E3B8
MEKSAVQRLVEQTGLTKQDLAAALGASVACLRRWERGDTIPDDKRMELNRLAQGGKPAGVPGKEVPAVRLAQFPSDILIEELARRSRGGLLRDSYDGHSSP